MPYGTATRGVILITIDTLRADRLGAYGNSHVLTLNIDRLASGGVLFRNAFAQATTTSPSHASLMTSLYPQDHNVYSNFEALGDAPVTLAEALKAQGFATFGLANMRHLNPEVANLGQGFDTYVRSSNMRRAGASVDQFLEWQENVLPQRFFAWLHLADVHTPYHPPEPYNRFYYSGDEHDPSIRSLARIWPLLPGHMVENPFFHAWLASITDLSWVMAQYAGAVSYVDNEVGRLLDALEDRHLLDKTAIILTADHGESLGEHGMYFVHTGLYEATAHVPLLMYLPGSGRQGSDVRDVVELVDVYPTVLDYLNVPASPILRGRSLLSLMRGMLAAEHVALIEHAGRNQVALRSGRYKYIKHLRTARLQPSYPFIAGKEELYDLREDPRETSNLSASHPDLLRVFRRNLQERQAKRMNLQAGIAQVNQETHEVLRSLGYVR